MGTRPMVIKNSFGQCCESLCVPTKKIRSEMAKGDRLRPNLANFDW